MISLITRTLLGIQLLVVLGIGALLHIFLDVGSFIWACALGLCILGFFRAAITANNFFISWLYRSPTPESCRINFWQACRMFAREFKSSMWSSSWTMAFFSFHKRPAKGSAALPVLLIHGYGCNSGYWHLMSKAMMREQITHHAVNLEPVFARIEDYVASIAEAVDELCMDTASQKIIILAHSMGGLAARAYLRKHGTDRIAKVITLGTPHHGTGIANFGRGLNCEQMRWSGKGGRGKQCDWLDELEKSETRETRSLFVSIYSHHDNIVSPQVSARLADAKNIGLKAIGHVALGFDESVARLAIEEIHATTSHHVGQPLPIVQCA